MSESRQLKLSAHTPSILHALCLSLALLSAVAIGLWHVKPAAISPEPATISPTAFSVARAQPLLAQIARQAHPVGTPENAQVADFLQAQLRGLGLQTEVQEGIGFSSWSLGRVRNIVARLPGKNGSNQPSANGSALLMVAHYDAAPTSPGAADNGASIAALLETLRALKSGPPLANDVVVLFSDGEEAGMLGAQLFAREHHWLKSIGLVLNFEYRGNRGPFWMYESSPGNGKLVQGLQQALPHAHANSVLYEVYKTMPNYTDFTQFKKIALPGLNFAAIEGHSSYHTQLDTPANLDLASWQDEGQTMLTLARYFGDQDLRFLQGENRFYFDLPLVGLISYSSNWPWTILLGVLLLTCLVKSNRLLDGRLHQRWGRTLLAVPAVLLTTLTLGALCFALWQGVLCLHPTYRLQVHGSIYNQAWYFAAMLALALVQFALLQRLWRKWLTATELLGAAAMVWFALALLCSVVMPGAALIFTWPLLPVLLVWLALVFAPRPLSTQIHAIAWASAAWCGLLFLTPLLHLIFIALTPTLAAAAIVVLALQLALFAPLWDYLRQSRWSQRAIDLPVWLGSMVGILCLLAGSATADFNAQQPRPGHLAYLFDGVKGEGYWFSRQPELDDWNRTIFAQQGSKQRPLAALASANQEPMWVAGVKDKLPLPTPTISVLSDRVLQQRRGMVRSIELQISSNRDAPMLRLELSGGKLFAVQMQGHRVTENLASPWHFNTYGLGKSGMHVVLEMEVGSKLQVRALDRSYHLPATPLLSSRPAGMIAVAFSDSDTSAAFQEIEL